LVVDDNVDAAETLSLFLKFQGHKVTVVYDGVAAVEATAGTCYDVLIVDIGLPRMDGYQMARVVRQQEAHRDALMIAASGYGQVYDRRMSQEAGFDHHLTKPVDFEELARLFATCGRRNASQS
jgi:two-component system CheB/CheR fusion protein